MEVEMRSRARAERNGEINKTVRDLLAIFVVIPIH
jgi:hypothetical protein